VPNPIATIAAKYKGSYDLAGVAEAIRDSGEKFSWVDKGNQVSAFEPAARGVGAFCNNRSMNCYEFVHFCAFLCGPQSLIGASGITLMKATAASTLRDPKIKIPSATIAQVTNITRGAVVAAVKKETITFVAGKTRYEDLKNNTGGFFHVGIAVKGNTVIDLIDKSYVYSDLWTESLVNAFDPSAYMELWVASYNWNSVGGSFTSPLPSYSTTAGATVAAVGSGVATIGSGIAAVGSGSPTLGGR